MAGHTGKKTNYVQMIAIGGLLIAIEIILERFLEIGGNTFRYSFAFVARAIAGHLFGPVWTALICFVSDFLGATIKFGSANPFLSLTAILKGIFYGLFFYRKKINIFRIVPCVLIVEFFCGLLVNSTILYYMYVAASGKQNLFVYILSRAVQAVVMAALEIVVLMLLGKILVPKLDRILGITNKSGKFDKLWNRKKQASIENVNRIVTPGSLPGLSRVSEFSKLIGSPERNLKIIHVAGTNGKGSTSNMIASVLIAQGYKVGIFNSPYLSTAIEYFNINGEIISGDAFAELTDKLSALVEKSVGNELTEAPTEFEFYTCAALKYFADNNCDFAVLEAGMGGKDDATNFIDAPELALITNIGLDHESWLGNSIEEIAKHKAGIIKKGSSLVYYPSDEAACKVIEAACLRENISPVKADFTRLSSFGVYGEAMSTVVAYQTANQHQYEIVIKSPAVFQARNAALALEGIEQLKSRGCIISDEAVKKGFENFKLPARFEVMSTTPLIIADGGHNPQCIEAVSESLRQLTNDKKIIVLTGVMRDKDYSLMYDEINAFASEYIVVSTGSERALSTDELKAVLEPYGKPVTVGTTPADGAEIALSKLSDEVCLLITGTFYMMDEIRKVILK